MITRKTSRHLLPHFFADPAFADLAVDIDRDRVHHRAHALNLPALFIYLQVLVITGAGLFLIKLKAPQILGTASFSADQIISLTNNKRTQNGLGTLTYNAQLAQAASAKAADMFANDYWAHNSPSGKTPWIFISGAGYRYVFAGENLARDFDDAGAVVDAWMNSPSHRSNLLDKNFKEIGVAVASGKLTGREGILVVQMFGASISTAPTTQIALASPVPSPLSSGVNQVAQATPSPSPLSLPAIARAEPIDTKASVLSSRQFSIAKIVSLSVIGFIFLLFAAEVLISLKRANVRLRSGLLAHLLILAFILFVVWYAVSGAVI